MSVLWIAVIAASLASLAQKWIGYQVPPALLERPAISSITAYLPVALLGALVATQTFTAGGHLAVDSRLAAVIVAGLLLWRRAPFLVVVIAAAVTAAGLRLLGLP